MAAMVSPFYPPGRGKLYVGPVDSAKTFKIITALRYLASIHVDVACFGPSNNTRDGKWYVSKFDDTREFSCAPVLPDTPEAILDQVAPGVPVVTIDEVSLFSGKIVPVVDELLRRKHFVLMAGLDYTFRNEFFAHMPHLMANPLIEVKRRRGHCAFVEDGQRCVRDGVYTQRLYDGQPAHYGSDLIEVIDPQRHGYTPDGKKLGYECRCVEHHILPGAPSLEERLKNHA